MSKKSDLIVATINKMLKFTQSGNHSPESYINAFGKIDDGIQTLMMDLQNAWTERDACVDLEHIWGEPSLLADRELMQKLWDEEITSIVKSIKKIGVFDEQSNSEPSA